jgi:protein SCO1/2
MGRFQKILTTSIWAVTVIMMIFILTVGVRIQRSIRNSAKEGQANPVAVVQNDPTMDIAQASQLPVLFDAPKFNLLDQQNQPFSNSTLKGRPWLCQFIFTTCPSMCPVMMAKMARLQQSTDPRLQLISFSVDPDHDRPAVLKAKADTLDADPKRWHFLTNPDGVSDGIAKVQAGFFQGKPGPGEPLTMHSDKFFLVDGDGHVRGIYSSGDADQMMRLQRDQGLLVAALPVTEREVAGQ